MEAAGGRAGRGCGCQGIRSCLLCEGPAPPAPPPQVPGRGRGRCRPPGGVQPSPARPLAAPRGGCGRGPALCTGLASAAGGRSGGEAAPRSSAAGFVRGACPGEAAADPEGPLRRARPLHPGVPPPSPGRDRPHVPAPFSLLQDGETFTYRPARGLAVGDPHTAAAGWAFPFPGVLLLEDFLSRAEEAELVRAMDQDPWKPSQSGRRKQDYGPKVNFKKQKLRAGCFVGLPSFSQDIVKRMRAHPILEGFLPVEQCNLDYLPERGSAIDPHLDDWWLWGERLVSLNLLSKTVLSMSCDSENSIQLFATPSQESEKPDQTGSPQTSQNCKSNNFIPTSACENSDNWDLDHTTPTKLVPCKEVTVAVHLPRRSLVVLYGAARYKWKHAIHRKHIEHRRVCITFRELSTEFSLGGKHENLGKELLDIALSFQGKPV